jgi:uncharacterized membrane protein
MAGIGFQLRNILAQQSFTSLLKGYGYAGLISSGPWVLSILAVMGIGALSVGRVPDQGVRQFLVSVTYLMAGTLVFSGGLQLMLTRFVADRIYEDRPEEVVPNLLGALAVTAGLGGIVGAALVATLFGGSITYRVLMVVGFVILAQSWIAVVLLSGLKQYGKVLATFLAGYAVSAGAAVAGRPWGAEGLLAGFISGQALLLVLMTVLVVREYPARQLVSFEFLDARRAHYTLFFTGCFYNLGIWADKILFWLNEATSEPIVAPLRASTLYDIPIFLAYLSIAPGMAVFLMRVETDFAENYDAFFKAVRRGGTLAEIGRLKDAMTESVWRAVVEILRIQGVTVLALIVAGPQLLPALGISPLYLPLLSIHLVGAAMQVLLLASLNVLFYLDQRRLVLCLGALFCGLNFGLTALSQALGPEFYGYGFAVSTTLASLVALLFTSRSLDRLEYETFMLQR